MFGRSRAASRVEELSLFCEVKWGKRAVTKDAKKVHINGMSESPQKAHAGARFAPTRQLRPRQINRINTVS